jgi:hypothetical protein
VGDDGISMAGGEFAAARRAAGLRDDRLPLRCRSGIERTARLEPFPFEIDVMDLCRVDKDAALPIGDDRARLPRVPQPLYDRHVFIGHVVAQIVLGHAGQAEIHRRVIRAAGDRVPADPARRHLVERRHQPGQKIGVIGIGAKGRDDADARGNLRHQRGDHRGVLARHCDRIRKIDVPRSAIAFADIGRILDQHVIEAGALQGTCQVEEQLWHHPARADMPGPRLAPSLGARPLQKPREMKRLSHF